VTSRFPLPPALERDWSAMVGLAAVVALGAAQAASACPSCVDPRDATRGAMLAGTIALSLLPLGFIGGVVVWVWRAQKHSDDDETPPS
jgi:hypothetical protein